MSLARERLGALSNALLGLPRNLPRLAARLLRPDLALRDWCRDRLAAGELPVAICRIERLGDIVATTAVASHLRRSLGPGVRIAWVCAAEYVPVLEGNPDIDAIFVEPCLTSWMMLRRHLPRDALVVELFLDSDRCGWTGLRVKQNPSGWTIHNYYNDRNSLLAAYSATSGHPVPDIAPSLPRFAGLRAAQPRDGSVAGPLVAMHFTSRDPARSWPAHSARLFSEAALAAGCNLIELGEQSHVSSQLKSVKRPPATGDVSAHLMALARADYFVGVDSGFAHCANALRIPSLILLGEFRDFPDYFPFSGPHARSSSWCILRSNGALEQLEPDEVCAALLRLLAQESPALEGRSCAKARSV